MRHKPYTIHTLARQVTCRASACCEGYVFLIAKRETRDWEALLLHSIASMVHCASLLVMVVATGVWECVWIPLVAGDRGRGTVAARVCMLCVCVCVWVG
ncbi:hypothetical protein EON63_24140 [archaeon]|nr:MAG: hypothetical protein EON63_24140 [archaeon]